MNRRAKTTEPTPAQTARYADMFAALGTEVRLQILRLLLSAHPGGMVVGDIQSQLDIPPSTLSHHLERLKSEGLVMVQRESTFLRYAPTRRRSRSCSGSWFRNAVPGARPSASRWSPAVPGQKGEIHEQPEGNRSREVRRGCEAG